ncbi:hypothetical protein ACFE04_026322 [Oxalis oulophora]
MDNSVFAHQRISRFTAGFDNQVQWTATVDGALFSSLGKSGFGVIFSGPDSSFLQAISGWFEGVVLPRLCDSGNLTRKNSPPAMILMSTMSWKQPCKKITRSCKNDKMN